MVAALSVVLPAFVPNPLAVLMLTMPASIVVVPVYEFAPRTSVPVPFLVQLPAPLMAPDTVNVPAVVVTVPPAVIAQLPDQVLLLATFSNTAPALPNVSGLAMVRLLPETW